MLIYDFKYARHILEMDEIRNMCDNCNKVFTRKSGLMIHQKKRICYDKPYKCKYCSSTFSMENSMYRHMKHTCSMKNKTSNATKGNNANANVNDENKLASTQTSVIQEAIDLIKREKDDLMNVIQFLVKQLDDKTKQNTPNNDAMNINTVNMVGTVNNNNIINNTVNNNNNTTNNNTTINIVVGYGKEDLTRLNRADMVHIARGGYMAAARFVEIVHFNPEYPEFSNLYLPDTKNKHGIMFDGEDWIKIDRDDLIDKLYEDKRDYIEDNLDELVTQLLDREKKQRIACLRDWLATPDSDPKIKCAKQYIKDIIHNKRKYAVKSKKQMDTEKKRTGSQKQNQEQA